MSMGEQDEVNWLATDEAVRIERTAANLATLVDEGGTAWLGSDSRVGWNLHRAGIAPTRTRFMAGWLARQIWCHGRGDDTEHVCRCTGGFVCIGCLDENAPSAAPVYYPGYVPHDADQFAQMMKLLSQADSKFALEQLSVLFFLDPSFHREDIAVAVGRVAREKGLEQ